MYSLHAFNSDCFQCPYWGGTGCMLTACNMTKTYIYVDGKIIEYGKEVEDEN